MVVVVVAAAFIGLLVSYLAPPVSFVGNVPGGDAAVRWMAARC